MKPGLADPTQKEKSYNNIRFKGTTDKNRLNFTAQTKILKPVHHPLSWTIQEKSDRTRFKVLPSFILTWGFIMIWGSHGSEHLHCDFLRSDAIQYWRSLSTFRTKLAASISRVEVTNAGMEVGYMGKVGGGIGLME